MLTVDVGNSRIKWGVWKSGELQDKGVFSYRSERLGADLDQYLATMQREESIYICCVASDQIKLSLRQWFKQQWDMEACFVESQFQFADVRNGYQDPQQLGSDRWVAMVAAYMKYRKAVCVIDCGTAITVDVVNAQGWHLGGLIMPGLSMMRNALYTGTGRINPEQGRLCELALNTADAVYSGCHQLLLNGLQGLVEHTATKLEDCLCVITGGDGELLVRNMGIRCCYDEDLVLFGLNLIANIKE